MHQIDDATVAAAVGPTLQRLVRIVATALTLGAFAVAGVADLVGVEDGVPSAARWAGGLTLAGLGAWASRLRLDDPATVRRNMRRVERYPVLLALLGGVYHVGIAPTPVISLFLLFVAVFGSLVAARRSVVVFVASITLGVQVLAMVRATQPDWFITSGFLVVASLAIVVARTAGIGYRGAVAEQLAEQQETTVRAERLRIVADAARDLHVLDPDALLSSIADVAGRLGWDEVGIWGASTASGTTPVGSATASPAPGSSLVDTVARRGITSVSDAPWDDGVTRATVGVPLVVHGVLRGALVVARQGAAASEHEASLVELLADQAARAVELIEDHASTRIDSADHRTDPTAFLATVSHELRTPLHVVLGYAETIDERWAELDERSRRQMIERLRHNARGLHHVIDSMLDYSRLAAGAVEAHRRRFAIVPVVHEVIERLQDVSDTHHIRFYATGALDGGITWGDPLLVERVVENLVSNALRHTPDGTNINVVVSYEEGRTRVIVRDDGPGMSQQDVERLGRRFFRASTERGTRGVGLGLAFSTEVLRLHNSHLEVAAAPGAGASFSFSLPRTPVGAVVSG